MTPALQICQSGFDSARAELTRVTGRRKAQAGESSVLVVVLVVAALAVAMAGEQGEEEEQQQR